MGYRSIRRVLGETSLERKCRVLFGLSLLVLIGGTFWWVDRVAERLVLQTTRRHARDQVHVILVSSHADVWETRDPNAKEVLKEAVEELVGERSYRYEIITRDLRYQLTHLGHVTTPRGPDEAELLARLEALWQQRQAEKGRTEGAAAAAEGGTVEPVFADRRFPENNEYHYYAPIEWSATCRHCHLDLREAGGLSTLEAGPVYAQPPMFAIKVIMPYKETEQAIHRARAILITVAILSVFLSMVALYVIVRYVIVKPLKHLRDVSDQVSRGRTDVRADIRTNDEFQELAESFNRMLHHLTDAHEQLRRVNRDLDAKVDELAQLNMRLYEMNRLKDDFLANMSHELRTPLNSIIGFSEVLATSPTLTEKQRRYARNIQEAGRLLLDMINDILDLAKLDAGKMDVRLSEFRIDALVQAQCDMVRPLAERKHIELSVRVPPDLPPLFQDQAKIQQILTNLLSNAIKFTPEGGRVCVQAQRDQQGNLVLTVADTGVGIPEDELEVIFEKFRQSSAIRGRDGLTREYSGTGLGLSIVRELCKLLGGDVSVESELGKGSTFRVVLPWQLPDSPRRGGTLEGQLRQLQEAAAGGHPGDATRALQGETR